MKMEEIFERMLSVPFTLKISPKLNKQLEPLGRNKARFIRQAIEEKLKKYEEEKQC